MDNYTNRFYHNILYLSRSFRLIPIMFLYIFLFGQFYIMHTTFYGIYYGFLQYAIYYFFAKNNLLHTENTKQHP